MAYGNGSQDGKSSCCPKGSIQYAVDSRQTTTRGKEKTLILGIGNILRRDDGVGIHVINRLKDTNLPSEVMLLDGGTAGVDLLHYLQGINKLIIIDAILTGEKPGTIHILSPENITMRHSPSPTPPVPSLAPRSEAGKGGDNPPSSPLKLRGEQKRVKLRGGEGRVKFPLPSVASRTDLWERDRVRGAIHEIGLMETLEMANLLWGGIETVIIGVVPKDYLNYGIELTPEVNNAIEHVINICMSLLSLKA